MNLFLIGHSPACRAEAASAEAALRSLLDRLPELGLDEVSTWRAPSGCLAAAWSAHPSDRVGGVSYVHAETDALALFAGRPIRWTGEAEADGRGPLDPRFWLRIARTGAGADALDGRFAAAAYEDRSRRLELRTDPVGAYPLFAAERDGVRWIANNPEALRALVGRTGMRHRALASLIGGGWSLEGHPVWEDVERLEPGVHVLSADEAAHHTNSLPAEEVGSLVGRSFDAAASATLLRAATRALADWPSRPSIVPITAGRDSRLVLAAALAEGIDFEAGTQGYPGMADYDVGRAVCARAGIAHRVLPGDPCGDAFSAPSRAASFTELASAGTASLADGVRSACDADISRFDAGPGVFPLGPREGTLPLVHTGQGGELSRAFYGVGEASTDRDALAGRLYRLFTGSRPWRPELLSEPGREAVHEDLRGWVGQRLDSGCSPAAIPDLFYFEKRMGTWAGATQGCVEYVQDSTSPLWSVRLLPHLLGLPAAERAGERFHRLVLDALAPALAEEPMDGGRPWAPAPQPRWRRRLRPAQVLARKARDELVRRAAPIDPRGRVAPEHPLAPVLAAVRERALEQGDHPAWAVLDRARVERLLDRDARTLDGTRCQYVWRLATVFLPSGGP